MRVTAKLDLEGETFADLTVTHEIPDRPGWPVAVAALRHLADTLEAVYDDETWPPRCGT